MKLFGLKNCDTCHKALKALRAAGHEPDFHDVRVDGVEKAYLTKWAKATGWEQLLNTRSTTWRGLSDKDKANVDEKKAIALMEEHPALIKRPVIECPKHGISVGWTKDVQNALLK
ncbi:Protein YffB [Durusdinium trenchii]|uniref:Protein YffB n=1 Tax=Durusdinium trenchii TaxID=1381693 RepID=A0ABP0LJY3_9DINO